MILEYAERLHNLMCPALLCFLQECAQQDTLKRVYIILLMVGLHYSASSDYLIYPFLSKVDVGVEYVNLTWSIVT